MKHGKHLIMSLYLITFMSTGISGLALIDDIIDNNENEFGYYWYFNDDKSQPGVYDRLRAAPGSVASKINGPSPGYYRLPEEYGANAAQCMIRSYTFTPDTVNGNHIATIPFTLGEPWVTPKGTKQPYVEIGTMLCEKGKSVDLSGATSVFFMARSRKGPVNIRFQIRTREIDSISWVPIDSMKGDEFGYYEKVVNLQPQWSAVDIKLSDLTLPDQSYRNIPFNSNRCTQLVWQVMKFPGSSSLTDTLDIDNVIILGKVWNPLYPRTIWKKPNIAPIYSYGIRPGININTDYCYDCPSEFNTFENVVPHINPLGLYWYAFDNCNENDNVPHFLYGAANPYSKEDARFPLIFNKGTGCDTGKGIFLAYQLGKTITGNGLVQNGSIGVSTQLSDSASSIYWDAKADDASVIFFRYLTSENPGRIRFTLKDSNDVSDSRHPLRKDSRAPGVYWHKDLPPTSGSWSEFYINFEDLVCDSGPNVKRIPLDSKALACMDWTVDGYDGQRGIFALDDIYFGSRVVNTKMKYNKMEYLSFGASYSRGMITVNLPHDANGSGTIRVVNAMGVTVKTVSVDGRLFSSLSIPAGNLSSGIFYLTVNMKNADREQVLKKTSFMVLK